MATLTVRNLDDGVYERLKERARRNQRSLEAEARVVLGEGAGPSREEAIREMEAIRRSLEGRYTGDPTAEIRAERDRRG
jgi:plasmid stability protein